MFLFSIYFDTVGKIPKQPYPSSSCYTTIIVVPVAIVTFVMGFVFGTLVERRKKSKKCSTVNLIVSNKSSSTAIIL